jgi:hypothetical protein
MSMAHSLFAGFPTRGSRRGVCGCALWALIWLLLAPLAQAAPPSVVTAPMAAAVQASDALQSTAQPRQRPGSVRHWQIKRRLRLQALTGATVAAADRSEHHYAALRPQAAVLDPIPRWTVAAPPPPPREHGPRIPHAQAPPTA